MSYGNCGTDSNGRPVGHSHSATCDYPGCSEKIDRGLSYACGGEHGETERGCEKHFCTKHLNSTVEDGGDFWHTCDSCASDLIGSEEWEEDPDNGCIVRVNA